MKWTHLATASDQLTAEMWRDALLDEGIPAVLRPSDAVTFMGLSPFPCRLMVPENRLEEAEAILAEYRNWVPDVPDGSEE